MYQHTRTVAWQGAAAHGQDVRLSPTGPSAGWPESMLAAPAPVLPKRNVNLRIYIYDLPPQYNIWLTARFRRPGRWDQSYLYSLDAKVYVIAYLV